VSTRPAPDSYTDEEFKHAVVVANDADGRGDLRAAMLESERRYRGAQKAATKVMVTIRLERDAVTAYRASGRGWQTRLSDDIAALARRRQARRKPTSKARRRRSGVSK
jgi:uncharacterized protein (DUF4415 family)